MSKSQRKRSFGGIFFVDALASSVGIVILLLFVLLSFGLNKFNSKRMSDLFEELIKEGNMPIEAGAVVKGGLEREITDQCFCYKPKKESGVVSKRRCPLVKVFNDHIELVWLGKKIYRHEFHDQKEIIKDYVEKYKKNIPPPSNTLYDMRGLFFLIYENGMYHFLNDYNNDNIEGYWNKEWLTSENYASVEANTDNINSNSWIGVPEDIRNAVDINEELEIQKQLENQIANQNNEDQTGKPVLPSQLREYLQNIEETNTDSNAKDSDRDGIPDNVDAFPTNPNEHKDTDQDGIGDIKDEDDDNDGIPDVLDQFPLDPKEQSDNDKDGVGDNEDQDDDNDGIQDQIDQFPLDHNNNGQPDETDTDDDSDGVPDSSDQFPLDRTEHSDNDKDGIGDNKDEDDDNDGIPDIKDMNPLVADSTAQNNQDDDLIASIRSNQKQNQLLDSKEGQKELTEAQKSLMNSPKLDSFLQNRMDQIQSIQEEVSSVASTTPPASEEEVLEEIKENLVRSGVAQQIIDGSFSQNEESIKEANERIEQSAKSNLFSTEEKQRRFDQRTFMEEVAPILSDPARKRRDKERQTQTSAVDTRIIDPDKDIMQYDPVIMREIHIPGGFDFKKEVAYLFPLNHPITFAAISVDGFYEPVNLAKDTTLDLIFFFHPQPSSAGELPLMVFNKAGCVIGLDSVGLEKYNIPTRTFTWIPVDFTSADGNKIFEDDEEAFLYGMILGDFIFLPTEVNGESQFIVTDFVFDTQTPKKPNYRRYRLAIGIGLFLLFLLLLYIRNNDRQA